MRRRTSTEKMLSILRCNHLLASLPRANARSQSLNSLLAWMHCLWCSRRATLDSVRILGKPYIQPRMSRACEEL